MIYHALGLHGLGQCRSSARITLTYSRHICMAAAVPDVITKPVYGICRNGAASQTSESAAEWLRHAPRGKRVSVMSAASCTLSEMLIAAHASVVQYICLRGSDMDDHKRCQWLQLFLILIPTRTAMR